MYILRDPCEGAQPCLVNCPQVELVFEMCTFEKKPPFREYFLVCFVVVIKSLAI